MTFSQPHLSLQHIRQRFAQMHFQKTRHVRVPVHKLTINEHYVHLVMRKFIFYSKLAKISESASYLASSISRVVALHIKVCGFPPITNRVVRYF